MRLSIFQSLISSWDHLPVSVPTTLKILTTFSLSEKFFRKSKQYGAGFWLKDLSSATWTPYICIPTPSTNRIATQGFLPPTCLIVHKFTERLPLVIKDFSGLNWKKKKEKLANHHLGQFLPQSHTTKLQVKLILMLFICYIFLYFIDTILT